MSKKQKNKSQGAAASAAFAQPVNHFANWPVLLLAVMMFLTPAVGVPHEEMLQDTLKSMVVSFMALISAFVFVWSCRQSKEPLKWHVLMWLPVLVCVHALSAMLWAHNHYLPGVEAIRWFVFGWLLWVGLNHSGRDHFQTLALGIHWGAFAAAFWGLMQFWFDMRLFPQGPNPASTFVNRNFGAEFMVTTLPYSVYLLFRSTNKVRVFLLTFTLALNMVYIMACGTRAALISLMFMAVPLVVGLFIYQPAWQIKHWSRGQKLTALGIFVYALAGFGSLPSGNAAEELRGYTAFQRTFVRTQTLAPTALATEESFGMRRTMWSATLRMIADRPISGVGGGVWEVDQPLYLPEGATLETDYYVHNEFLQHIAEYGLIGWLTICGTVAYLALAAWRTFRDRKREEGVEEGFVRMTALCSLFALFVVSNAGFPWRMATTCALFALGLAVVAASDARMGYRGWLLGVTDLKWNPAIARGVLASLAACLVLAVYISERAAVAEHKIVYATKLSLGVTQSGNPNAPQFQKTREDINRLIREGVAINPHYRKITPMVADNMAGWGDWVNAVWLWESVLGSRPYIMAIMANAAKGNFVLRDYERSSYWVQRMQELRPNSVTARSLQVTLLDHQGKRAEALKLARQSLDEGMVDADLAINTFIMARDLADVDLGIRALEWRNRLVPREASQNHYKAGMLYDQAGREDKALEAFRLSLQAIPAELQQQVRGIIPAKYHSRL